MFGWFLYLVMVIFGCFLFPCFHVCMGMCVCICMLSICVGTHMCVCVHVPVNKHLEAGGWCLESYSIAASLSQVQGSQYGYCHQPSCSRDPLTLPLETRITGVPPILLLCGFWVWRWSNSLTTEFFPSHFKVTTEHMGAGRAIKSRDSIWQTATYVYFLRQVLIQHRMAFEPGWSWRYLELLILLPLPPMRWDHIYVCVCVSVCVNTVA